MAGENKAFLVHVRGLDCRARGLDTPCGGAMEAHHAGIRGLGQRAHDESSVPLCTYHHREFHDATGAFKTWRKAKRRTWIRAAVRTSRWSYARAGGSLGTKLADVLP